MIPVPAEAAKNISSAVEEINRFAMLGGGCGFRLFCSMGNCFPMEQKRSARIALRRNGRCRLRDPPQAENPASSILFHREKRLAAEQKDEEAVMGNFLILLGAVCLGYYAACIRYAGVRVSMLWIWLVLGIAALGAGAGMETGVLSKVIRSISRIIWWCAGGLAAAGICTAGIFMGLVISAMRKRGKGNGCDRGSGMPGEGPGPQQSSR